MKKILILAAAAFLLLPAAAQQTDPFPSSVMVNGRAEKEITPNEFYLSIVISERDSKGRISVEQQQREMIAALRKLGVDVDRQLKMANLSSEHFKRTTSLSTVKYQLKLSSPATVSDVYEALSALGISNVSLQRVTHSQMEQYKVEVRIEAIRNAKATAASLAEAIGQRIGKCFSIVDYNNDFMPAVYDNAMFTRSMKAETSGAQEDEPLDFKTIRLTYSVQAKFVLE